MEFVLTTLWAGRVGDTDCFFLLDSWVVPLYIETSPPFFKKPALAELPRPGI